MNGIGATQFELPRQLSRAVHDGPTERYMGHVAPVFFEPFIHERENIRSNAACQSSYDFDVPEEGTGHPLPLLEKATNFGASGFLHVTLHPCARIEVKQISAAPG
jgi:hypothetical protein